ncbi:MAG: hypothetical protein FD177_1797 [Desulfovibrionaceae bacterium]|nr:MAG: hypothetical protein FD177_1797 [Desulfovibrionaceae bacterium]
MRRAQRSLALAGRHTNLLRYLERDSLQNVAGSLVERYMPRSSQKQLEIADVFRELYAAWLVLAPLSNHAQGYWRSWWCPGVVTSWLRIEVNRFHRCWLGHIGYGWATAQVASGAAAAHIIDEAFIAHAQGLLDHTVGDTLRAGFARYVLGSVVWCQAAEATLQVARECRAGMMWSEDGCWLMSAKPFAGVGVEWSDLREQPAEVLAWRALVADGLLNIRMNDASVQRLKESVRTALATDASPEHKLRTINAATRSFHHFARYAFDARQQAQELEAWVWRRVNRHLVRNTPSLADRYFNLRQAPWDTRLHFERKSYLLDKDVTEEAWLNLWNPRR